MPKLKVLSGIELIGIFINLDFKIAPQRGSHIKLVRYTRDNEKQVITVPNHNEIDKGTLKAIIRQAQKYISSELLKIYFYNN